MAPPLKTAAAAKRLVLLGGGHAHALVARDFALYPLAGVQVTMVSDTAHAPYSGMVPGYVAGFYGFDDIHIDLRRLCQAAGVTFVEARVTGLDLGRREVIAGDLRLPYDLLSINIGITPDVKGVPGAADHAVRVKPVSGLLAAVDTLGEGRLVIVGAGAGGVELALALRARMGPAAAIELISEGSEIMASHPARVRRLLTRELEQKNIAVRYGCPARQVEAVAVVLADGSRVAFDRLFWATYAAAAPWLAGTGLSLTADGFVRVRPTLQSVSHPDVFAAGDIASFDGLAGEFKVPKSGVYAVREGGPLAANLRASVAGRPLEPFVPQRQALALIGTGDGAAVASRGPYAARARWLWWIKDRIDRRFMALFDDSLARKVRG